jgi:hypothetical protein
LESPPPSHRLVASLRRSRSGALRFEESAVAVPQKKLVPSPSTEMARTTAFLALVPAGKWTKTEVRELKKISTAVFWCK